MCAFKSKLVIWVLGPLFLTSLFSSCNDDTGNIGTNVMPGSDITTAGQAVYNVFTNSLQIDSLIANTSLCYLGRVTDPETNATTTSNFLAQFYCLENYTLPLISQMNQENGKPKADSVDLRLYIKSYYGDSLNSMKIGTYELDSTKVMEETSTYYTNLNPTQYLSTSPNAINKETTFAVTDLETGDSLRYSSSYSRHIRIKLPASYGTKLLNLYYTHPEYFKNSYSFIRHVVPGFYFKVLSGNGTMANIDASTLNIYFNYTVQDSTYHAVWRVAATEEVLQNNAIENKGLTSLVNNKECTYLKTPAGIFTEVTLPIDSIYQTKYENDSVNSAKIVFKRQNNNIVNKYSLSTASELLIMRKSEFKNFFENHNLPDGKTSFVTSFSSTYNSFTFSNIANLIAYLKNTRDNGADIKTTDTEAIKKAKIQTWETINPDWNKVLLVPVQTETNSAGTYTKIYHEFGLTSTKLVGGDTPISMSIVYSHFN